MKSKPGRSFFIFILFLGTLISVGGFLPLLPLQGNFSGPGLNQFELGKIQSIEFLQKNVITWPLYFIPNLGQLNGPVDFYLQGRDKNIYFNREGLIIALNHIRKTESIESNNTLWATRLTMAEAPAVKLIKSKEKANINRAGWKNIYNYQSADDWNRWVVKLSLVGANPEVTPIGLEKAQAKISYFRGSPDHWLVGIPTYSKISYPRLWPGINLNLAGDQNSLKSEFFIEPGADLSCLRLKYEGISGIYLNAEGQLEIQTPAGNFVDDRPFAYQIKNGQKIYIPVSYKILEQKREPSGWLSVTYTFKFGAYDPERPLYLDPAILIYSGYLGGSSNDRGLAVAIDSAGNAYLTGWTASYDFPVSVGPDPTFNGPALGTDAFVAKINPSGTGLIYCGYLGGSFDDSGNSISVDSSGNAYVCGFTKSPDFPVVVGPFTNANGNITQYGNGFITKINADGTALIYSGYLGGSLADQANGVAVDSSGRAYVCGTTESSDFPTKTGPFLRSGGLKDAFVLRIAASGSQVDWSGFIGGTRDDIGSSIAVDSAGNAYVTGYTASTPANQFPVKNGPKLTQSGGLDAFVAKVDTSGASLLYCGYIGGSSDDYGSSIAVDSSGNAYITGATLSATNFPATVGPDVSYNGGSDAFVAKINPTSTALLFCGYVGGSADDFGTSIAVDAAGLVYLVGATESANFPVTGGPFLTYHGNRDAFVCVLRADGQGYYYSSFLGGSDLEEANGVAADGAGNIYVAGFTRSADFPTLNGPFLNPGGGIGYLIEDAFITRIYGKLPPLAPQNLRLVNVTDTEANLAWDDKSNNEDGFKIERKTGVPGSWNQIALVGANITAYKNTGLTEATTYYYRVRAYNDIGDSLYSNELSVLTRPAAPSNLVAKVINERQIDLTWNDNSSGETGFRIERKIGSGNWTTLTTLAANVTSYSDTSVIETTTYSYRVFAFSGSGDSASSNEVTVTTPALTIPLAPSNLQAQAVSASQVSLSWTDNSYNEDGFKIERKTGAGGTWNQAATVGANVTRYLDGSVTELTNYYYRVRAYNQAGDSDYSNEASVTTPENKPKLRVPIAGISFGNVNVCSQADGATIVYNDGGGDLTVSSISRASGSSDFIYIGPAFPFTVPAFSSKIITIRFAPSNVGAVEATFNLLSNDADNPTASFNVSGTGFIPVITISLEVERRTEKAWIISRDYGRLTIVVNKEAPFTVAKYRLWRKANGGTDELRKEFTEADFSYGRLVYIDKYLDKGQTYTYRVEALDCYNRVIATSGTQGPFFPLTRERGRPGKIVK